MKLIADGLRFPEGPIALRDGSGLLYATEWHTAGIDLAYVA